MMATATRVLVAELDSPAQARRFANHGPREAITELSGMLRIGMLVSGTILVTDAMLLDGEYFISLGPHALLHELGATQARYPLTITGVQKTLREGLESRLKNPDFQWSLAEVSGTVVPDKVQRVWDEWIRLVESGIINYEQQTRAGAPLRTGAPPVESEAGLVALAASGIGDERRRSVAWQTIDRLDLSERSRERVRGWWNDAYLRMIAENADADWLSFESGSGGDMHKNSTDVDFPLSAKLLVWARESTPATVALAWDASTKQRQALHTTPTWARMKSLVFAVTQITAVPTRTSVLVGSFLKLLIALVVVALAVPGLQIGSIESPWTWVAFVGVIATTVPFDSLLALLGLLQRDPRARLVLHRGRGTA